MKKIISSIVLLFLFCFCALFAQTQSQKSDLVKIHYKITVDKIDSIGWVRFVTKTETQTRSDTSKIFSGTLVGVAVDKVIHKETFRKRMFVDPRVSNSLLESFVLAGRDSMNFLVIDSVWYRLLIEKNTVPITYTAYFPSGSTDSVLVATFFGSIDSYISKDMAACFIWITFVLLFTFVFSDMRASARKFWDTKKRSSLTILIAVILAIIACVSHYFYPFAANMFQDIKTHQQSIAAANIFITAASALVILVSILMEWAMIKNVFRFLWRLFIVTVLYLTMVVFFDLWFSWTDYVICIIWATLLFVLSNRVAKHLQVWLDEQAGKQTFDTPAF